MFACYRGWLGGVGFVFSDTLVCLAVGAWIGLVWWWVCALGCLVGCFGFGLVFAVLVVVVLWVCVRILVGRFVMLILLVVVFDSAA